MMQLLNNQEDFEKYTFKNFVKCRDQKEWICDKCGVCGDKNCCQGSHTMHRVPNTDVCLCSSCLNNLK